jgi:hypothetical protein
MNEDVSSSERCPICDKKECQKHLLARFDASGDEGEYGIGLVGGPLYYEYEIEEVLKLARLAWVRSVRATTKPEAPRWIMNERGLKDYFNALGSGGFDLRKYENDEEAAAFLPAESDCEWEHAREDFLWEVLFECGGDVLRTEEEFSAPLMSTTYLSWWTFKPKEIVKKFRAKLRSILLEAGVKLTKRKSWAAKEKEELERMAEGAARLMKEKARDTTGADASKPPSRTPKSGGAKRSGPKRASKRKSARRRQG